MLAILYWLGSLVSYLFAWGMYVGPHALRLGHLFLFAIGLLFHMSVIPLFIPHNAQQQDGFFDREAE